MKNILISAFLCVCTSFFPQKVSAQKWTCFRQELDIPSTNYEQFRVSAYVKTKLDERAGWAGVWVRIEDKNEKRLFFNNMYQRPIRKKNGMFIPKMVIFKRKIKKFY